MTDSDRPAGLRYFEDMPVGLVLRSIDYVVAREEVIAFARKWDPQPFHIDEEAARRSVFGGLTACSAHIFSMFSIISQQPLDGSRIVALAGLGFEELQLRKPVYAGDTLYCESTVLDARRSASKPDRGVIAQRAALVNQRGEAAFECRCKVMMQCYTIPDN